MLVGRIGAANLPAARVAEMRVQIFNLRLDACVTAIFMGLVALIIVEAARVWYRELGRPAAAGALGATAEPTGEASLPSV